MSRHCGVPLKTLLFLATLCQLMLETPVRAGNCWLQQGANGRCQGLLMSAVSREECCRGGRAGTAWTRQDVSSGLLFRWLVFSKGAPDCQPCKETCDSVECGPGKQCKLSRRSRPRCVCAPQCPRGATGSAGGGSSTSPAAPPPAAPRGPVCGSDGQTYRHECALLRARCRLGQTTLHVQYQGKCRKSCRDVQCSGSASCVLDQSGAAHCVECGSRPCREASGPDAALCSREGRTYDSLCHLRRAACLRGRAIAVAHPGSCNSR
ncbi:follistatin-A-like [Lampetra fluviatilis]